MQNAANTKHESNDKTQRTEALADTSRGTTAYTPPPAVDVCTFTPSTPHPRHYTPHSGTSVIVRVRRAEREKREDNNR